MRFIITLSVIYLVTFRTLAQGVHLGPGDSLTLGFNGVDRCFSTEGTTPGGFVVVGFGTDLLSAGESLRLDLFENEADAAVVASQVFSPGTSLSFVDLTSPGSWLDNQGVIRVTMLAGAVDIDHARFIVSPNMFTYCPIDVAVPEPFAGALLIIGAGTLLALRQRKKSHM